MLQELFRRNRDRYLQSPFRMELEEFGCWLRDCGYHRTCTCDHLFRLLRSLERLEGFVPGTVIAPEALVKAFEDPRQPVLYLGTRRAYERYLTARGRLLCTPGAGSFDSRCQPYREYLADVRGFAPTTIAQHCTTIMEFLGRSTGADADAPLACLGAEAVERYVAFKSQAVTRQTLQHIVAHLRAFLRYLYQQGEIATPLDRIDTPRTYRDELPPRALDWALVQKLLRSIDRSSRAGWRDYVILHLMAHYGLRPSEVAAITLDAIDWERETLRIRQRKTRSDLVLPLAPPTVRLLRRYLRCGRSGIQHPALFLRARCPVGGITHYTVGDLYQKRVLESGLPLQGTSVYALRHTFAMRLLGRGVGIKAIGDLLGHRTLESTCVYLRLDIDLLRAVALPVPVVTARSVGGPRHV